MPNTAESAMYRDVPLDNPITRGDTKITALQLRRPNSGELRGLTLSDLARMDVNAMIKLLPRIATPSITEADAAAMPPEDLFACATEIGSFFLQKADLAGFPRA
jgi:Phage tail protein E.